MKILQNIADFGNSRSLSVLHNRLELEKLRKERASRNSYVNNVPLNEGETALFNAIYTQYKQKIIEEARVSSDEAEKLLQSCVIEPYGKKNLVTLVSELKLYRGVPAKWLLTEAFVSIIATLALQHYYDLGFSSCLVAYIIIYFCITFSACIFYEKRFAAKTRQEKISAILNGRGINFYGKSWLGKK